PPRGGRVVLAAVPRVARVRRDLLIADLSLVGSPPAARTAPLGVRSLDELQGVAVLITSSLPVARPIAPIGRSPFMARSQSGAPHVPADPDETSFTMGDETDRIEAALLRVRGTLRWVVFFAALGFLAQVPSCVNTMLTAAHLVLKLDGGHLGGVKAMDPGPRSEPRL